MAREPSVVDGNRSNSVLLDRRTYLKSIGIGSAAVVGAVASAGASTDDYETITVSAGERRVITVESNGTFENVLIDQTADGAAATIEAWGTDWTIRNVAFAGEFEHDGRAFGVADTGGGTSRIENVYLGDGVDSSIGSARHPKLGLWVSPDHSGELHVEGMYVAGAKDNAFYGSAPGSNGNGQRGSVHYENCYARDCRVSGFRISRGTVTNCVGVNTDSGENGRPLWVWPTEYHGETVEVRDCDFVCGSHAHGYDFGRSGRTTDVAVSDSSYSPASSTRQLGDVRLQESNVGHDAQDRIPEGCPSSVEEVFATGSDERSSEDDDDNNQNQDDDTSDTADLDEDSGLEADSTASESDSTQTRDEMTPITDQEKFAAGDGQASRNDQFDIAGGNSEPAQQNGTSEDDASSVPGHRLAAGLATIGGLGYMFAGYFGPDKFSES